MNEFEHYHKVWCSVKPLRVQALLYLGWVGDFEEKFHRFLQVTVGYFDGVTLTGDIKLGTKRNVSAAFFFNNRCQLLLFLHCGLKLEKRPSSLHLLIDLSALLHKLRRFLLHAALERLGF